MDAALDEIEFLALSANRVTVLNVLSDGSYTRRELAEHTDASQPTLGRVLRDLAERHWIVYDGERYTATATGQLVATEFTELRQTLETELRLRKVVEWMPTAAMDFDLRHLSNATITLPTQTRPDAPVQRVLELLGESNRVRIFSHAFNEQSLGVIQRRTADGIGTFEGVFSPTAVDALADDSTLREKLRQLTNSTGAEIRLHDDEIPFAVTIVDTTVHLLLRDDNGLLRAALDTDNEAVLSWANETHERFWRDSKPIDAETLV